jgi:hypothetical protein
MEPKTIRESIDTYREKIAREGFLGNCDDQRNYPQDNHPLAMKSNSDYIRKILEDSGKFSFEAERKPSRHYPNYHAYVMKRKNTETLVGIYCVDKKGEDFDYVLTRFELGKGWIPMQIHPATFENGSDHYIETVKTIEALLYVAEEHKIEMVTEHKSDGKRNIVRFTP